MQGLCLFGDSVSPACSCPACAYPMPKSLPCRHCRRSPVLSFALEVARKTPLATYVPAQLGPCRIQDYVDCVALCRLQDMLHATCVTLKPKLELLPIHDSQNFKKGLPARLPVPLRIVLPVFQLIYSYLHLTCVLLTLLTKSA